MTTSSADGHPPHDHDHGHGHDHGHDHGNHHGHDHDHGHDHGHVSGAPRPSIRVEGVLGGRLDPPFADHLHRLAHAGACEELVLDTADLARHRLRAVGSLGSEFLIALPRDVVLFDGAVIACSDHHGAVVRVTERRWLRLRPASAADALELGWTAGNLHWRVRFADGDLAVALEGPIDDYLARLAPLIAAGRVDVVEDGA